MPDIDSDTVGSVRPTFDQACLEAMRKRAVEVIAAYPEVRSIAVVVDYRGGLNDARVPTAVWVGEQGPVEKLDAVFGSIQNVLGLVEQMFARAVKLSADLRMQAFTAAQEVVNKKQEIEDLEREFKQKRSFWAGPLGEPANVSDAT